MTQHVKTTGFTLIELMFALTFVGFILIFAVTTTIQAMQIYSKGLTIKEINQTARTTLEEISRVIRSSTPGGIVDDPLRATPSQSRVCFGGISYVWNVKDTAQNKYDNNQTVRFARVNDPGKSMCQPTSTSPLTYPAVPQSQAVELLTDRVWIQQLEVTPALDSNLIGLYIQLSTTEQAGSPAMDYNLSNPNKDLRVVCKPGEAGRYCAVASFGTTVNARGGN